MVRRLVILSLLVLIYSLANSQSPALDSLYNVLKNITRDDTTKVNILNDLSYDYRWIDFSYSQRFAEHALKIAKQLGYHKGIATANYRIAHCYWLLAIMNWPLRKDWKRQASPMNFDSQPFPQKAL